MGKFISLALGMLLAIGVFTMALADGSGVTPTTGIPPQVLKGADVSGAEQKVPIPAPDGISFDDQQDPDGIAIPDEEVEVGEVNGEPPGPVLTDPGSVKTYTTSYNADGTYELRRANAGMGGGVFVIRFYSCLGSCHEPGNALNVKNLWKETVEYTNPPPPEGDGEKVVVFVRKGTY